MGKINNPMNLYLVKYIDYEDFEVYGIYLTKKSALSRARLERTIRSMGWKRREAEGNIVAQWQLGDYGAWIVIEKIKLHI